MDKKSLLQKSKYYLTQGYDSIKEVNDIYLLSYYAYVLSQTEEQLGNYHAALDFHKEYSLYNDSIYNDENKKKLAAMETERLAEVKDKEIKLEASEIKRQGLTRNVILVSVGIAAALCFLFIRLFFRRRKAVFDTRVMEVEMKALRAQMNPHFIFNSLQSINKYVMENDRENASAYLSKFSNLMRLILENSREQEVPLQKDLQALELYVQLESLRFQNRFKYSIETDPGIDKENTLIPPLLLQPFVENAIIHGIQSKENGFIKVRVSREGDMMRCVVEDNGAGRQNVASLPQDEGRKNKSLGIKIINERLNIINQLKKVKAAINIFDLHDGENKSSGLRIELLLPLQLAF
jgi:LytS/YehU family sensor histidine kinase